MTTISYNLKRYKKSKKIRIIIKASGDITVTAPYGVGEGYINEFVQKHTDWISQKLDTFKSLPQPQIQTKKGDYKKYKEYARELVHSYIQEINSFYNLKFNKIYIKQQRTRWGSCSNKKNLNFNYKIIFLPKELAQYVVVHELCHLREMNHGKNFWNLVAQSMPNYKKYHRELRKFKL